jgi:hypothetical protein
MSSPQTASAIRRGPVPRRRSGRAVLSMGYTPWAPSALGLGRDRATAADAAPHGLAYAGGHKDSGLRLDQRGLSFCATSSRAAWRPRSRDKRRVRPGNTPDTEKPCFAGHFPCARVDSNHHELFAHKALNPIPGGRQIHPGRGNWSVSSSSQVGLDGSREAFVLTTFSRPPGRSQGQGERSRTESGDRVRARLLPYRNAGSGQIVGPS